MKSIGSLAIVTLLFALGCSSSEPIEPAESTPLPSAPMAGKPPSSMPPRISTGNPSPSPAETAAAGQRGGANGLEDSSPAGADNGGVAKSIGRVIGIGEQEGNEEEKGASIFGSIGRALGKGLTEAAAQGDAEAESDDGNKN